jgi:hypothetical protein
MDSFIYPHGNLNNTVVVFNMTLKHTKRIDYVQTYHYKQGVALKKPVTRRIVLVEPEKGQTKLNRCSV